MRFVWLIPLTVLVVGIGAGAFFRARRRANDPARLTSELVSGQWLAEARGREEQRW